MPCVGDLALEPWRVVGVKWMLNREASPLSSGVVAPRPKRQQVFDLVARVEIFGLMVLVETEPY